MSFGFTPQCSDAHVSNLRSASTLTTTRSTCSVMDAGMVVAGTINGATSVMPNVITTEGDLVVGDATGNASRLPVGAVNTVLTSNGVGVEWQPSAGITTTQGDLVVGNGLGEPSRLPIGTIGTVLTSNGTTAIWQTQQSAVTTQGDLIVANVSGEAARLPIGVSGTTLTSTGTTAQWQAPVTTATGDLIVGDSTGSPARLPIGAAESVLASNGTTAVWRPNTGATALAVQYNTLVPTGAAMWLGVTSNNVLNGNYVVTLLSSDPSYLVTQTASTPSWIEFVVPGNYLIEFSTIILPTSTDVTTLSVVTNTNGASPFVGGTSVVLSGAGITFVGTPAPQCLVGRLVHSALASQTMGIVISGTAGTFGFDTVGAVFSIKPLF